MDGRPYIHSDPEILLGKPVVRGTRLAVDFILGRFAAGWTEQQVLENYATLTPEALRAVFAFAAECMREETLYAIPTETSKLRSRPRAMPPLLVSFLLSPLLSLLLLCSYSLQSSSL